MSSIDYEQKVITVVAAIIRNEVGHLLLVRKKNTNHFMQVGGKLEANEAPEQTLLREIEEEISVSAAIIKSLGLFKTRAANEAGFALHAYLFEVKIEGEPQIAAEIAEMCWLDPQQKSDLSLAPLTTDIVLTQFI